MWIELVNDDDTRLVMEVRVWIRGITDDGDDASGYPRAVNLVSASANCSLLAAYYCYPID